MKTMQRGIYTGERALFGARDLYLKETIFEDGESPLKESADIKLSGCLFRWKYPLWYSENVRMEDCTFFDTARAGVWYTKNIALSRCVIESPKNFRRCDGVNLSAVQFTNAAETLWSCKNVKMERVLARGDYFAMNCENMEIENFTLTGNYGFDGAKNVVIRNAKMLTKDAFWNSENVTVYDSHIYGEYLGWNAKHLKFVNCTIESLQGMCYIEDLVLDNCRLVNTTLAFEYSSVRADISGRADSVKNPLSGYIVADDFGEIISEEDKIDPSATRIERRKKTR